MNSYFVGIAMMVLILLVTYVLCYFSEANQKLGLPDDNLAEETIEEVIKEKTDIDLDLTPSTPEKK